MKEKLNARLACQTLGIYVLALLVWTLLFWKNTYLKAVLLEIHITYTATLLSFLFINWLFKSEWMEFIRIFIRTLFRVWLIIFITFAIAMSQKRVGILLSLSFIFGYLEGLMDISKWLQTTDAPFKTLRISLREKNRLNVTFGALLLMSFIHILCALLIATIPQSIFNV